MNETLTETLPPQARPETRTVMHAENLHRYLGDGEMRVHALRGVKLAIESHTTYSIVGPSGCGKSTLLYLLGLLDRPDAGEIYLDGNPMAEASDELRTQARNDGIGFVFQFHFLLQEFTAAENIMMPMRKLGKMKPDAMRKRALELLGEVGLEKKADRLATNLSGGEQQRVAIARALANEPHLILADEPTGNLDQKNSDTVFDLLYRLSHERGQAIVMVTHNPELADRCDRTLKMRDGQFEKNGGAH